jgi:Protein of unknown function (DUF2867)
MQVAKATHESHLWRLREFAPDFALEDVWELPVHGSAGDFQSLLEQTVQFDPSHASSGPARFLWRLRDRLGAWLGLGRVGTPVTGAGNDSLAGRLPADLRHSGDGLTFRALPFTPLFRTADEFAAEISNPTMHGIMHLVWVARGDGRFQARMAVYVKPHGVFGRVYMALIKPFRL